jgi:hypothetical protein
VGLLRHAAFNIPALAERGAIISQAVGHEPDAENLADAYSLLQAAARISHDPVYSTGAFYALHELQPSPALSQETSMNPTVRKDEITEEVERGLLELFERIGQGATLDEALALFPLIGDELSPNA